MRYYAWVISAYEAWKPSLSQKYTFHRMIVPRSKMLYQSGHLKKNGHITEAQIKNCD